MRILIAEDDPVSRRMLQRTLEKWGHQVVATPDGQEAWEQFSLGAVDMVITDWMMPGMDGLELCRRIQAARAGLETPVYVILLTARTGVDDLAAGIGAGADDFIAKPFQAGELRARLHAGERTLDLSRQLILARQAHQRLALTDQVTDLPNRRALLETLRRDEDRCRRERQPLGVVVADLDHFKEVNDRYGHQAGDRVLRHAADTLRASVRGGDVVGRWGGEEFLLVLPGADLVQTADVAERCREGLATRSLDLAGESVRVTASFGAAATEGPDREDVMELVQQADKAMYWAKHAGRNQVKIYLASADPARNPRELRP